LLAEVREIECHAAATLGQLKRGVDRAGDRLHVVLDAQEEAGDQLTALRLTCIEEGRGGRLEAARDDLVDDRVDGLFLATREEKRNHDDAVLEALEVTLTVEGLQRVRGVVLVCAEEG